MRWVDGQVEVEDGIRAPRPLSGEALRDGFFDAATYLSLGLIHMRDDSLHLGPWELIHFDLPVTTPHSVSWPIEGGALAGEPGGYLEVRSTGDHLIARVEGYRPRLPKAVYVATQLPVHHAVVRLQLLRLRGRQPAAGVPADVSRRLAAGVIDLFVCAAITLGVARRRRLRALMAIATGYHLAAWAVSGKTVGGAIMRQRVLSVDGTRPSLAQAALRFVMLPFAAIRLRALHDEVAATDVVADSY